ncbi:MAG: NAD(P)H-binding protein [Polyangiaceae bacterium]|nr:NAD(P)H-binding protein [Polyangiaceae bacterium]
MHVVFGITGRTAGVAARALVERSTRVRGVGRNAERLRPFVDLGIEAFVGNVEDATSVQHALAGAVAAYLLIPPNFAVDDFRAFQRRAADALANGVAKAAVRHVVLLSSLGANHPAGTGPIVGLHELEQRLRGIPRLHVLSIRAGYFMENFLMNVEMVRTMGILGTPAPRHAPLGLIAAADIGRYAARRLHALDFNGFEVVNLIGPSLLTMEEVAKALGQAIGKPELAYVQFSHEDAKKGLLEAGLKPQLAALYLEMHQGAAAGLLQPEPGTSVVNTDTPIQEFAQAFGAAYRQAA